MVADFWEKIRYISSRFQIFTDIKAVLIIRSNFFTKLLFMEAKHLT